MSISYRATAIKMIKADLEYGQRLHKSNTAWQRLSLGMGRRMIHALVAGSCSIGAVRMNSSQRCAPLSWQ